MSSRPVLVIGLDGVDFRYLDQFAEHLPNIQGLRESGAAAPLRSTHPPWTGSAWPSMYTGLDPSEHGVYDFFDYADAYPDEADIVSRNDVKAPAIWNYLSEVGRRSVVLNVPVTHPAEALNGILIPGYLAPADEDGYPAGIRDRLSNHLGRRYRIYSEFETDSSIGRKIEGFESLIRMRAEAADHLLSTESWDFAFVQVQKTDSVFHSSSSEEDFERILVAADDLVGRVVDAPSTAPNVVIVSDHGIGPVTGRTVYVNEILREHGFVETKSNPTDLALSTVELGSNDTTAPEGALTRALDTAKRYGFDPTTFYRIAERLGVATPLLRAIPRALKQSLAEGVDWRESAAYCRRKSEQGIRINLEGRDSAGVVPPEDYEQTREAVIRLLADLETEGGEPLFELVAPREELYRGAFADDACDVLFRTTAMDHEVSTHFHGRQMATAGGHGHKQRGVFIASGPDVQSEADLGELSLLDVAPLLFGLMDVPVPERMTGVVPAGLLAAPVETKRYEDVRFGTASSYRQDPEEVAERLGDLGYL